MDGSMDDSANDVSMLWQRMDVCDLWEYSIPVTKKTEKKKKSVMDAK